MKQRRQTERRKTATVTHEQQRRPKMDLNLLQVLERERVLEVLRRDKQLRIIEEDRIR